MGKKHFLDLTDAAHGLEVIALSRGSAFVGDRVRLLLTALHKTGLSAVPPLAQTLHAWAGGALADFGDVREAWMTFLAEYSATRQARRQARRVARGTP